MPRTRDLPDEPTMSDATILVTVEDLINRAMGPSDANVVNFKLIQTILHILARQQRMLQQRVEIKIIEIRKESTRKKHADESTEERSSTESPSPAKAKAHKSPQRGYKEDKTSTQDVKDKDKQKDRTERKDHERDEKVKSKEKGETTTPYKTKQMQMMVNKIEEEEEEEEIPKARKEQGTIKQMLLKEEKIGQRKPDKMSQRESERRGNEEKIGHNETDKMSHRESEKWETKEKRKQKEPDRIPRKEKESWELEEKMGQKEPDQLTYRETEKREKRDNKGLKEPYQMSEKEREIFEKEGKLGHAEISRSEKDRWKSEEKMGQLESDKKSTKESEGWGTEEKRMQKEPDRMSHKKKESWELEVKIGQKEPDQLTYREMEKREKRDNKGLKEPYQMSEREKEIFEKEGKLGHAEISLSEKDRWKSEEKMGQLESDKKLTKESEGWGTEEKRMQKEPDRMSHKEKESWELEVKIGQKEPDQLTYREIEKWEIQENQGLTKSDKILKKEREIWEKDEQIGPRKPDDTSEKDRERWKEEEKTEPNKFEKTSEKEKEKWKEEEKIDQKESGKIAQNEREGWEKGKQHQQPEKIKFGEVAKLEDEQEYEEINQKVKILTEEMGERKIFEKTPHTNREISERDKMEEREEYEKNKRWENKEKIRPTKPYETSQKEKERWEEEEKNREPSKMSKIVKEKEEKVVFREPDKIIRKERLKKDNVGQHEKEEMSQKEKEILEKDETFGERVTEKMSRKERKQLEKDEMEKVYEKTGQMSPREKERWKGGKMKQTESYKISQKEKQDTEKITGKRETENLTTLEEEKWGKVASVKTQNEKDNLGREKIKEEREKHKQKAEKERSRQGQELERKKPAQRSSIEITEKIIDNEKILVVGKRQPTRHDAQSSSSIDVVTRSQFDLLEEAVKQLRRVITPSPLQLPDNKQLMSDVMKGTASLPDAMQTLQIDAKLRAAEDAVVRMAGLLTQLAAAGDLPEEMLEQLEALQPAFAGLQRQADDLYQTDGADKFLPLVGKKSVAIDPRAALSKASRAMDLGPHAAEQGTPDLSLASRPSAMSRASRVSTISATQGIPCVTHEELNAALNDLRDAILKTLNNMTVRASTSAENALHFAKLVADKLDVALQLDERISTLYSVVGDYSEQLNGFDSGLTTQMQSFQDQMAHMRADLHAGLVQLENVNNNAETAAVLELTERFEELAGELDDTLHAHKALAALQAQLGDEMRNLVECMEMLREQKADRDEVLDGLRDKADTSRLAGLLSEEDFAEARADFERRIDLCHEKFTRQDEVWQKAIRELKASTDKKAELVELLSSRDETQCRLQQLNDKIRLLAAALGEPKTALLTRKLAEGATCGSCHVQALMEPYEVTHGAPHALPALRPAPVGASDEPCITDLVGAESTEERHICHRWCGGSHTLVTESTRRATAPPAQLAAPTRKFQDYGDDGRLYMLEEECQPCVECNLLKEEKAPEVPPGHHGAGDMSAGREPALECTCALTE